MLTAKLGSIKLSGLGEVPRYDMKGVADAKGRPASDESVLCAHLPQALALESSQALQSILQSLCARESEWSRAQFKPHDERLCYALAQAKVGDDVRAAAKANRNGDMRPEIALAKATESAQCALVKLRPVLQGAFDGFSQRLESAKAIRLAALKPHVENPQVAEMRAVECRRHLFAQSEADRVVTVLGWASRGGLEAVAACASSPTGSLVPVDALRRAQDACLEACGMIWCVRQCEDEGVLLEAFASRLDVVLLGVKQSFAAEGFNLQLSDPYPRVKPFTELAQSLGDQVRPQAKVAA